MLDRGTNTQLWTDIDQNQHIQLISNLNRSKSSFEMSQNNVTNLKPIKTSFFWEMAWKDKGKFVELDCKEDLILIFINGKWSQFTAQWKSMYFST